MKLSEFKKHLKTVSEIVFLDHKSEKIPSHFHITEIGEVSKKFIDCGGTIRFETKISMQLWTSIDIEHRLSTKKLLEIINLSEKKLNIQDLEIEIEYQMESISKFSLEFKDGKFHLISLSTNCLASDSCGIPVLETKIQESNSCCDPTSNCC